MDIFVPLNRIYCCERLTSSWKWITELMCFRERAQFIILERKWILNSKLFNNNVMRNLTTWITSLEIVRGTIETSRTRIFCLENWSPWKIAVKSFRKICQIKIPTFFHIFSLFSKYYSLKKAMYTKYFYHIIL